MIYFFQTKEHILEEFSAPDGQVQLVFASEALSMGTDIPDIRQITHFGVPNSISGTGTFLYNKYTGPIGLEQKQVHE